MQTSVMAEQAEKSNIKPRVEDLRFLTGRANYVDDSKPEKVGYLGLVRSNYAHANIVKVDFSNARNNQEFIDGLAGVDLVDKVNPLFALPGEARTPRRYHLGVGKVRYVGEPVAAIVARRKYSVEDLAEEVNVEYEPIQPVVSIEESRKGNILLYDEWKDNVSLRVQEKTGEAQKAIGTSHHVVRKRIGVRRQAGTPIEPRSVIASYDGARGTYDIYATVQSAHRLRNYVSAELRIPADRIHARVSDVGGGFGVKGAQSYPEAAIACIFAKRTGLTIKWTSTRTEDLLESAPGRDEYCDIELACDSDAKIVALGARVEVDLGAGGTLSGMIDRTVNLLPGAYKIPNIDIEGTGYVTNKTPSGPVRGAGRPEACFFVERAVDIMAAEMKMDPLEFRRRNLVQANEFPYNNGAGYVYDNGNFPLLLETVANAAGYNGLKQWRDGINGTIHKGGNLSAGIGICMVVEDTGALMSETAKVVLKRNGDLTIFTGSSPHGQGHETTYAQIASRELGIPIKKINLVWGDTGSIPKGVGTFGSRSAAVGGSAVVEACRNLRSTIIQKASELLGRKPADLDLRDGMIFGFGGVTSSEQEVVWSVSDLADKVGPMEASAEFSLKATPFSSGAHICTLVVDLETGKIGIERYVAVDDCGTVINPEIVDGQMHGGIVHGVGGALLEELSYDEEGHLLTSNFLDYTIPTSMDVPFNIELEHIETPSPWTLNGAKGVGESGTLGAYPAVFNALNDALSQVGSELNIAPATPESVLTSLRAVKKHDAST